MTAGFAPRLLIKMTAQAALALGEPRLGIAGTAFAVRELCRNDRVATPGAAATPRWYLAQAEGNDATSADLWDAAHEAMRAAGSPLAGGTAQFIEPDLAHSWLYENRVSAGRGMAAAPGEFCGFNDQLVDVPQGPGFAWDLGPAFSKLATARGAVGANPAPVRVGILDVGFDFSHHTCPENIARELARNFVDDAQASDDASDQYPRGLFQNPGHGTGTLGILAGGKLVNMLPPTPSSNDYLGGAPLATRFREEHSASRLFVREMRSLQYRRRGCDRRGRGNGAGRSQQRRAFRRTVQHVQ